MGAFLTSGFDGRKVLLVTSETSPDSLILGVGRKVNKVWLPFLKAVPREDVYTISDSLMIEHDVYLLEKKTKGVLEYWYDKASVVRINLPCSCMTHVESQLDYTTKLHDYCVVYVLRDNIKLIE